MSAIDTKRYQGAFRFHPQSWREQNESVAVGILMDVAESSGRKQLSAAERLNIYAHAASVWGERILNRRVRDNIASLAFGTGIAVSIVYLAGFVLAPFAVVAPLAIEAAMPTSKLIAGVMLVAPWVVAGLLAAFGLSRASRSTVGIALIVCLACGVVRMLQPEVILPSTLTLVFFGLWAMSATIGRVRPTIAWLTASIVFVFLATALVLGGFIGSPVDTHFWVHVAYMTLFPLAGLFICAATAAMCGKAGFALAAAAYATPWTAITIGGYIRDGHTVATATLMSAVWLLATFLVVGIARLRKTGPFRTSMT